MGGGGTDGVRTQVNSKRKSPLPGGSEEDQTSDAASDRAASPTHYQLSYLGPQSADGSPLLRPSDTGHVNVAFVAAVTTDRRCDATELRHAL